MKILQYPSKEASKYIDKIINRGNFFSSTDIYAVSEIIETVKNHKDRAVIDYINEYDCKNLNIESLKVSDQELDASENLVDMPFKKTLDKAIDKIESFHKNQIEKSWFKTSENGEILGQIVNPVDSACIYVPGGQGGNTPLVSSVLMGVIPAKIAGVKDIHLTTPCRKDGTVNPYILFAAKKLGINSVFKIGSAWAIAAFSFGTQTIPKVNIIAGPGNKYVTIAKKLLIGTVGIDMLAGPSEILVIADDMANPAFIAADLLSQAEHDAMASSILITTSNDIANKVNSQIDVQLKALDRANIASQSLDNFGAIFIVDNLDLSFELSNNIAPEHLQLCIKDPFDYINKIKNAGALFLGDFTPEPIGDYIAGPNHVLPTSQTAKFSSALSVENFIKKTSLLYYPKEAFLKDADDVMRLAEVEGLGAHANSVKVRIK